MKKFKVCKLNFKPYKRRKLAKEIPHNPYSLIESLDRPDRKK